MAGVHERLKRYTISIRKGDNVRVLSGRDAGKSGRVLSINPKKNTIIVEHANIIKRHTKPRPPDDPGGIIEKPAPMHLSNLALITGSIWMVAGIAYGAWKTRGFQSNLVNFDVPPEEE